MTMQTDVISAYIPTSLGAVSVGAITPNRARLKGFVSISGASSYPNFAFVDPTVYKTGTYSQLTTTFTVTITDHGVVVGQRVALQFTSGIGGCGSFGVATVIDANTFTVITPLTNTSSGNVTMFTVIEAEFGVNATSPSALTIPGEGILCPNGIQYVGNTEVTVFYG